MTDPTQLDTDVKRYLELDAAKGDIDIEMAAIKERFRLLGIGAHNAPCGVNVTISPNRRFNAIRAQEIVPAELLTAISTTAIDAKKAKAILPPAMYEQAMIAVGDNRVSVK